jgi:hypothetical protein
MGDRIGHRGPDGEGYLIGSAGNGPLRRSSRGEITGADTSIAVGFAHRRLTIIDLSERGDQPLVDASGEYAVVNRTDYEARWFDREALAVMLNGSDRSGRERAARLAGYQPEALASPSLGRLRPSAELAASALATTSSTIGWLCSAHSS